MPFRPANLVHTDEGSLAESTTSLALSGSPEPGTRSSAGEHPLHTGRVAGSIPAASTIPDECFGRRGPRSYWVYFVRAQNLGLIKIGRARDVLQRLSGLQTGSPDQLELMGVIRPADAEQLENDLHRRFRRHRHHGEWFEPAPMLLAYIDTHAISLDDDRQILIYEAFEKLGVKRSPDERMTARDVETVVDFTPQLEPDRSKGGRPGKVYPIGPQVPAGVDAPKGSSRKARMERYLLARGLSK